jgi:UDP-N-acetyl-D-mannosaminuronic acid dehydrogenase
LGVTYRPNVKEVAFSGAFDIKNRLMELGAAPYFEDPLLSRGELLGLGLEPAEQISDFDFAIIHTAHHEYLKFDFSQYPSVKYVIDGRGILGQGLGLINLNA